MKKYFQSIAIIIISVFVLHLPCDGKVYIDIRSPSATRLPIVIPDFSNIKNRPDEYGLSKALPRIIADNLEFSGFFRILDPGAVDASLLDGLTSDKIRWNIVSILGAEAVVTGGFQIKRFKNLSVELRIFDAVQGKFITGKKYNGKLDDHRTIAHKFSSEVFKTLTGERGVFETKIAFVKTEGENKDIYVMDYDGKNENKITAYNSLTLSPAWSPDGKKIAFTSYKNGNPDLYVKDIYEGEVQRISKKKGINISPSWSPDGQKIALTLSLNNGNSEIYTLKIDSNKLERITHDWATDVSPTWSPDGRKIAFVSSRAGSPQIYCLNIKTGKIKRLTYQGSYNTSPSWSPRGDRIAYAGIADKKFNIHVVTPEGRDHQQLTYNQGNNEDPSWAPDGRYLAYCSTRTGQKEIYIMRADGTGQKKITSGTGAKTDPAWSPFAIK